MMSKKCACCFWFSNSERQKLLLHKTPALITIQALPKDCYSQDRLPNEHRRHNQNVPPAERHVAGRHREAHWTAALLPFPSGKRSHHPLARYAGQDRPCYGTAFGSF